MRIAINHTLVFTNRFVQILLFCITVSSWCYTQALKPLYINNNSAYTRIKALSIGDKTPNLEFQNVLNYQYKQAKLSDFKGKLVLLDMWSVSCASCIAAFPKMEELQNQFKNKIQILLVNSHISSFDSEDKIKMVLERLKKRTGFNTTLPIPIHDSILNIYFPHQTVPHLIWIGPEGKILAITSSNEITAQNIESVLKGANNVLPIKNDWAFNIDKPLLVDNNGGNSNDFIFRSIFTRYKAELDIKSGVRVNENQEVVGVYMLNKPLRQYINEAYADIFNEISRNKIILDVKDSKLYSHVIDSINSFCYDLTIPPTPWNKLNVNKYLQEDLRRFFNITVHKEKRVLNCLVFKIDTTCSRPAPSKSENQAIDLQETSIKKYIHKYPVSKAIKFLEYQFQEPFIDETGLSTNIDIDFPENFNLSNSENILKVLSELGFVISKEEREIEVIIISDKGA